MAARHTHSSLLKHWLVVTCGCEKGKFGLCCHDDQLKNPLGDNDRLCQQFVGIRIMGHILNHKKRVCKEGERGREEKNLQGGRGREEKNLQGRRGGERGGRERERERERERCNLEPRYKIAQHTTNNNASHSNVKSNS